MKDDVALMTMIQLVKAIDHHFRDELNCVDVYTAALYSAELVRRVCGR